MSSWKQTKQEDQLKTDYPNVPASELSSDSAIIQPGVSRVKNIIAIASGKGGVGKSTVAANLAYALAQAGNHVGLMDADIYGPSQPRMLGADAGEIEVSGHLLRPAVRHGVSFISLGLLMGSDQPVVWRAPIASKMIRQFISNVVWGELNYLLIDLPPGTGDVQLTLAQEASLTGAIIVTTPQEVALGVARKGLAMFRQVNVPIVGVIENMSGFICGHCGQETAIFGEGGGKRMADEQNVPLLSSIPLDPEIMASSEDGVPVLSRRPNSVAADAYRDLADRVQRQIEEISAAGNILEPRHMELSAAGELLIAWPDGHQGLYTAYHLRLNCPCALCVDEDSGRRTLDKSQVPPDIRIKGVSLVGRYAIAASFSDGHRTGLYTFKRLRDLCECKECARDRRQPDSG